jgi:hypothetical protein
MTCDGFRILTDYIDILANDASTPLWNPRILPRPLNTTMLREIRLAGFLSGNSGLKVRGGIDFSSDGVNFPSASKELGTTYFNSVGWNHGTVWHDVWALTGVTRQLFARIGVQTLTNSGTRTEGAQLRLLVEGKPFWSETMTFGPRKVHTRGSTTALFCPMSEPIQATRIRELRATVDRSTSSGAFSTQPGWQETDTPEDPSSWSAVTLFGSATTADGYSPGTDFTTITLTKRYLRFGMSSFNPAPIGTTYEAGVVALRVDVRD